MIESCFFRELGGVEEHEAAAVRGGVPVPHALVTGPRGMHSVIHQGSSVVPHKLLGARVVGGGQRRWRLCSGIECSQQEQPAKTVEHWPIIIRVAGVLTANASIPSDRSAGRKSTQPSLAAPLPLPLLHRIS